MKTNTRRAHRHFHIYINICWLLSMNAACIIYFQYDCIQSIGPFNQLRANKNKYRHLNATGLNKFGRIFDILFRVLIRSLQSVLLPRLVNSLSLDVICPFI